MASNARERGRNVFTRWGMPGLSFALAMLVLVAVLPSALNVPQSNPSQTLEFAPVPPQDDEPPPPDSGNTSSLGLGSSSSLPGDALGGDADGLAPPPPPPPPPGVGERPVTKRCVGNPPRQTDDPLAPPCVAFFEGDNGGATYQGVTGDEIRIVITHDGHCGGSNGPKGPHVEACPKDAWYDLWADPYDPSEFSWVTMLRNWQFYFNDRYQTYGRRAHFFVRFNANTTNSGYTPEARRADAVAHVEHADPFAYMVRQINAGNELEYHDAMADLGVMSFPDSAPQAMMEQHAPLMWSYLPPLERRAEAYASLVCQRVAPFPVSFSGNQGENGQDRRYGLIYTSDEQFPELRELKDLVLERLEACGVEIAEVGTHPIHGAAFDSASTPEYAYEVMARFQTQGITTILWPGGTEVRFSAAAASLGYEPEWILAADGTNDGYATPRWQDKEVWNHTWVVTTAVRENVNERDTPCADAYRSVKPDASTNNLEMVYACAYYNTLRQIFVAVQVAGPRLTPEAVDKGFRAIPALPSPSPYSAACFYEPGDWTCVKDATAMKWDSYGEIEPGSGVGCHRMPEEGRRFLAGQWPHNDLMTYWRPDDPCNGMLGRLGARGPS
ncbi:MAG TPA: hypothetical protein VGA69_07940 [Nitriliruptorales bacterium]